MQTAGLNHRKVNLVCLAIQMFGVLEHTVAVINLRSNCLSVLVAALNVIHMLTGAHLDLNLGSGTRLIPNCPLELADTLAASDDI
jgi:hypothetical protein